MPNRTTFGFSVLIIFFVLAVLFAVSLYALTPALPSVRGPLLLSTFIVVLILSLLCILFFLRWMLRPYRQLVGEAERAPGALHPQKSQDEAQFVLETFQSIVAQLQSQQKELERLSAKASERADSAERFSDRIVASVPSGLVAFDGSGRSLVINAPGRALLNVAGDGVGQPSGELLQNLPHLAEMVETCLETGTLFRREEIQSLPTNGPAKRLGATVAPLDLSSERGALCLLTDITEVTQLREQVALKKNLESLGEMSAGLAHEFKNAIATLHGYAQLMQNLELDEAGRQATSSLLKEVRNLSEMVTAFLNFARPQPLQLEEVSLNEVIDACEVELQPLYEAARVELVKTPCEQVAVQADERMLRQAVLNLLRNAAEAIPEDKAERRVTVTCRTESARAGQIEAVIEIKDSGSGIPVADLDRIFIPFFTTKSAGHGIGLALTHRVITEHGGALSAANATTEGAVFTIRLPP
jgi:nitrogen fixation/metabolism regulation signal transduction histidine kinase